MADASLVMRKQLCIEGNYNASRTDFVTKKMIHLTEKSKLILTIFQEEENIYPQGVATEPWDIIPLSKVTYSVYIWEVIDDEYREFKGVKTITFQNHVSTYSRHLLAHLILKDDFKEENDRFTHYEVEIDVIIFEPLAHVATSSIEFL